MGQASNVIFGGVDLSTASPHLRIVDITPGGVEREISALNPPASDGQIFGSVKNGTRTIGVSFDIMDETISTRAEALRRLAAILGSREPLPLRYPGIEGRYIMAICTSLPGPSVRDWAGDMAITFLAHDPHFYSDQVEFDHTLTAAGTKTFYVNCSGSVKPKITQTIASPLTDPTWTDGSGDFVLLQGAVAAGVLVIDSERHEITLDGASIMGQLSLDSTFFEFAPNPAVNMTPYSITCANGAAGRMTARQRWI